MNFLFPKPSPLSPPMFENPFIDRFSRTHPVTVPLLYVPATAVLLWWSVARAGVPVGATAGLFFAGWLAWTLNEYWLHRTLFHWVPETSWGPRMHFFLHGVHHDWPRDPYRLVMPPAVSVTLFWLFLGFWVAVLGRAGWAMHAGFTFGYMVYDLTHYYLHHHKARWDWVKKLRRHHLIHHAPKAKHGGKFGVSTTLWDHVFGTM